MEIPPRPRESSPSHPPSLRLHLHFREPFPPLPRCAPNIQDPFSSCQRAPALLNKKISCNGSRNCRGEMDAGPPGMAGALGTAGCRALWDGSPHPRHQVPNAPALAAALLQLLDPLNVKLDVFLPKPGPTCKGSRRIVVSPPLPQQQQQQGGANLKKSTKASFFLRGVTPCRYRAKRTLLPAQAATGLWPNKAYRSFLLNKKKKKRERGSKCFSFFY